jgi:hypothetical protein
VRWDTNTDTPIPPDEAAGKNPPDGAILNFYLANPATGEVTLDIMDRAGKTVIRHYSSKEVDEAPNLAKLQVPTYWARRPRALPTTPGFHRVIWDTHYTPVAASLVSLPMQAVFGDTPVANHAPWVMPGRYLVRLTVNGAKYDQSMTIKMDPRVKTSTEDLTEQFLLSKRVYDALVQGSQASKDLQARRSKLSDQTDEKAKDLIQKLDELEGYRGERRGGGGRFSMEGPATLTKVTSALETLLAGLQNADVAPTAPQRADVAAQLHEMSLLMDRWKKLSNSL